jgi:hypothetical protein
MEKEMISLLKSVSAGMLIPVLISFVLRVLKHQPDKIEWLKEQIAVMHKVNLEDSVNQS